MLFNSFIFLFLFFPLVILGYFALAKRKKDIAHLFLIAMSFWFYGYFNYKYLLILIGSILINYYYSKVLIKHKNKWLLSLGIALNVGVIFYYKYFDFFKETINHVFKTDFTITNILLPLGISFFTFQQISFLVDSYRGETEGYGFIEYALFVAFFPQLIAGPIVLHKEIIPQFRDDSRTEINGENIYSGLILFCFGLFKKVLVADTFSRCVTWAWSGNINDLKALEICIVMLSYTFQIYFDFSAYSDMATGIGRMINIELPLNFDSPYKALSIPEFWKRWHLTLTRFLREYIYFPLGGSRKGKLKTYINILIVFLISGIWHGANWTFILWGVLHGLANIFTRMIQKSYDKLNSVFKWFITFTYVSVLWLLFRAESIGQWLKLVMRMVKMENLSVRKDLFDCFALPEKAICFDVMHLSIIESKNAAFLTLTIMFMAFFVCLNCKNNVEKKIDVNFRTTIMAAIMFIYSVLSISGVSEFIYFNF